MDIRKVNFVKKRVDFEFLGSSSYVFREDRVRVLISYGLENGGME